MTVGLLGSTRCFRLPRAASIGFLIGSIFPDLDFLLLIPLYPFDRDLALSLHRSFTHSLLAAALVASLGLLRKGPNSQGSSLLLWCALGMIVHDILDVFMWFAPVGLFWPFCPPLNVLDGERVPDIFWNLSFAFESAAYALFLFLVGRHAHHPAVEPLKVLVVILMICTTGLIPGAMMMSRREFEVIAYGLAIVLGFIPSVYYLNKFKHPLLWRQ